MAKQKARLLPGLSLLGEVVSNHEALAEPGHAPVPGQGPRPPRKPGPAALAVAGAVFIAGLLALPQAFTAELEPTASGGTAAAAPPPVSAAAKAAPATELLATLPVKGRAPKTGYDRELFGQAWADVDRNGCDTRNDMLNAT